MYSKSPKTAQIYNSFEHYKDVIKIAMTGIYLFRFNLNKMPSIAIFSF